VQIYLNLFNIHDPLTSLTERDKAFDSNLSNLINNALIITTIDLIQKCFQFIHHFIPKMIALPYLFLFK